MHIRNRATAVIACGWLVAWCGPAVAFEEPYCGLYSVHAALHALGISSDFESMVTARNVSGRLGSTAEDLMRIAREHGAAATFRRRMALADLRAAQSPVILHTSVVVQKVGYHHWLCFLGVDDDMVRVYDPPRGIYRVSCAELLCCWDGIGIQVSRASGGEGAMAVDHELLGAFLLVLTFGGVAAQIRRLARLRGVAVCLVGALSAILWHGMFSHGFIRNPDALADVATAFDAGEVGFATAAELRSAVARRGVTIVDARRPIDFRRSHVPGAINLPITVTCGELRETLAGIPRENRVIVYCQSDQCTWADAIARQFPARGYKNVAILRGGVNGWRTEE